MSRACLDTSWLAFARRTHNLKTQIPFGESGLIDTKSLKVQSHHSNKKAPSLLVDAFLIVIYITLIVLVSVYSIPSKV